MKKLIVSFLVFLTAESVVTAQAAKAVEPTSNNLYMVAMQKNLSILDTASTFSSLQSVSNSFERIANAEKNKWEPYYYAAYCYAVMALKAGKEHVDILADKADSYLKLAVKLDDNSEISALSAMVHACRIGVDPISRFQVNGSAAHGLLEKASIQNPANPRPFLLKARILLRTPEAMGGGKKPAKAALETAVEKFRTFTPASSISPRWGQQQAEASLDEINKGQ